MRRWCSLALLAFFPVSALLLSACSSSGPTSATPTSLPPSPTRAIAAIGPTDTSRSQVAPSPEGTAPSSLIPGGSSQNNSFATALQELALKARAESAAARPDVALLTLDGGSQRVLVTGENVASPAAAGPPSLEQPVVDIERRTVSVTWHRGFGDAPVLWKLFYTSPAGFGGIDLPPGTMSITASLPVDGQYSVSVCAWNGEEGFCYNRSAIKYFELTSRAPGPPAGCSATANGTVLTMTWGAPTTGGPVDTYVVIFQGNYYSVGRVTSASASVSPGRYLLAVFARSSAGDSAAVTCEATVGGGAGAGTYSGPFTGTGLISRTGTSCTWSITYTGTVSVTLNDGTSGLTGTINLSGSWNAPAPSASCLAGSGTYGDSQPVIISGTNIARTGLSMDLSTGTFSGNLSGTTITGTLTAVYRLGPGTLAMPVTLRKQ